MSKLVAIVGPTGVGKSSLSVLLAGIFSGEIVGADSRQVYRHMDIGTAKPSPEDRARVPHHLIDIIDPDEDFNLALYQERAYRAIADIQRRDRLPFLVGGTGLYIRAVLEGWKTPGVSPDPHFRYNIEKRAETGDIDGLYAELERLDPEAARKIDKRNVRRVVRALEVCAAGAGKFSKLGSKEPPGFESFIIGLTAERAVLYEMTDRRVDEMIERGLVSEVSKLLEMGYDFSLPSMSGIGYRQVGQYLGGEITLPEAVRRIKTETHRFIRHQYAWFKLSDKRIHWYDATDLEIKEIEKAVDIFIKKN